MATTAPSLFALPKTSSRNRTPRAVRETPTASPVPLGRNASIKQNASGNGGDGSDNFLHDSGSRKRIRTDTSTTDSTSRSLESSRWLDSSIDSSSMTVSAGLSPAPFVNTKYKLAGGLDTPTRITAEGFEALDSSYLDHDFRRKWSSARSEHDQGRQTITVTGLERERNGGRKRSRSVMEAEQQQAQESWGQFVFNVVGGIAGKMWAFCRGGAGAFTGFSAGDGAGYTMTANTPRKIHRGPRRSNGLATPIPGQFPEDCLSGDNFDEQESEARPAKRQNRGSASSDWVFVSESSRAPNTSFSRPSPTSHRSFLPRPTTASSPKSPPRPRSSIGNASYAGSTGTFSRTRAASFASPRATSRTHSRRTSVNQQQSPVEIDVARYTSQRQREERQADASMRKLNSQLEAMIRQGKEALATKFEVEELEIDSMDDATGLAESEWIGSRGW